MIVGAVLSGILIVERSVTLSHLLKRALAAANLIARSEASGYLDAVETLELARRQGNPYGVLIVGAPARMTREFMALLDYLRSDTAGKLAVLLLAHEVMLELAKWSSTRANSKTVLWAHFSRIPGIVQQFDPAELEAVSSAAAESGGAANAVQVLLVDDSQSVRLVYGQLLQDNGFAVQFADSLKQARERLMQHVFDLAIIDYFLPDGTGDELCHYLSQQANAPVLAVITGAYREDVVKYCLKAGAIECMFKNEVKELFLTRVGILAQQVQLQKSARSERQRLDGILGSVGDGVFGVDNSGVVTFINPTGLRLLKYQDESDLVGKSAYAAIHHVVEKGVMLKPEASTLGRTYLQAEALKTHQTTFWRKSGDGLPVECTVFPVTIHNRHEGSIVVFRETVERKHAEVTRSGAEPDQDWTDRLRTALQQERFVLLTRPIVPISALPDEESRAAEATGWRIGEARSQPVGEYLFEILIRMVGKDGRLIPPSVFIPPAQRAGMMPDIDLWVINRLLTQTALPKHTKVPIAFNVNLSHITLTDAGAVASIEAALRNSPFPAQQLVFQITETREMTNPHLARRFMVALKKTGCRFALDDFGAAFSSLTHLRHLPVDFVKVEGSLIEGMLYSERDYKMVESIARLANSLQIKVIGKHVDGFPVLRALRDCGVGYAQGKYLGEPRLLRPIDFTSLFAQD